MVASQNMGWLASRHIARGQECTEPREINYKHIHRPLHAIVTHNWKPAGSSRGAAESLVCFPAGCLLGLSWVLRSCESGTFILLGRLPTTSVSRPSLCSSPVLPLRLSFLSPASVHSPSSSGWPQQEPCLITDHCQQCQTQVFCKRGQESGWEGRGEKKLQQEDNELKGISAEHES